MAKDSFKILITVLIIIIGWSSGISAQTIPQEPVPPPKPLLKAVPGDGQVLLYWDERAEAHYDEYLESIGKNPENFEGYKVYKSTDPHFIDALRITDNLGNRSRLAPEAQFDLPNEISGYHPAAINGTRFYLGSDSGIQRQWLDTDVINGRAYYYAVVAYTHGDATAGFPLEIEVDQDGNVSEPLPTEVYTISPLESELDIHVNSNGTIQTGINTIRVVPQRPAAGVMAPVNPTVNRLSGSAGGTIAVEIIDPAELISGAEYNVVFQDTIIPGTGGQPDLPTTKNFSLINTTTGEAIFDEVEEFRRLPLPVREGFRLIIESAGDTVRANLELSEWVSNQPDIIHQFEFNISTRFPRLSDYRVEFFDEAVSRSTDYTLTVGGQSVFLPEQDVNFKVFNETSGEEIPFAFSANSPRILNSTYFTDQNTGFTVGVGGLLQFTEDGGENWRPLQSGVNASLNSIIFTSGEVGYAAGDDGTIIKTENGGEIWQNLEAGVSSALNKIAFFNNDIGIASGSNGILTRTTNAGETWSTIGGFGTSNLRGISIIDTETAYVVANQGRIFKTEDSGISWEQILFENIPDVTTFIITFNDTHFFDENHGLFIANNGRIFRTVDGGETLSVVSSGTSEHLNAITFFDTDNGMIVGNGGRILRTADGGDSWTVDTSVTTFHLRSVFQASSDNVILVGHNLTRLFSTNLGASFTLAERILFFRANLSPSGNPSSDEIFFIEDFGANENVDTWKISMLPDIRGTSVNPIGGDVLSLVTVKPFTAADSYSFKIGSENILTTDNDLAKERMSQIRVVPNPYLVTHLAETDQERQLHFTNLPAICTIRIFSVSGRLIQTLEVNNSFDNDRYIWDLRTNTNSPLPYGVYIYKVTAPDVGEKVGKFAVIK